MTLEEFRATGRKTNDLGEIHPPYKGVHGRIYAQNLWMAEYINSQFYIVNPWQFGTQRQCEEWLYAKLVAVPPNAKATDNP